MRSGHNASDTPQPAGVEKLLPCAEYIFHRTDRVLVHLVGDLPKTIVELSDGLASRIQPTGSCVLVFPADSFCLVLRFPRHLRALLTHSLGFTHKKPPRVALRLTNLLVSTDAAKNSRKMMID